jgi:hypothetical protein
MRKCLSILSQNDKVQSMDMKTYLKSVSPEERAVLAEKVERSVGYFYQISGGHRKPSSLLCKNLVLHEPRLSLHELRPDIWSEKSV